MSASHYNPESVEAFYSKDAAQEWERLVRTAEQEVKLHVHNHYLYQYLSDGYEVLEVGAGPGRFTKTLHDIGCSILVSDISEIQLDANREKATQLGFDKSVVDWVRADVTNLEGFASESFDAVVAYGGPLSYVFDQIDQALQECHRVLRPGGILIASVMSLWGTLHRFFPNIVTHNFTELTRTGDVTPQTDPSTAHHFHMYKSDELMQALERNGFSTLSLSASNSLSSTYEQPLEVIRTNAKHWESLLDMEVQASASPGLVEAGTHLIVVARK